MKALVYTGEGVALEERPVPEVEREDDVRIIVDASGICGTDRNIVLGHVPAEAGTILGHEAVGTVDAIGARVTSLRPGDRVVVDPSLFCGLCPACRRGRTGLCENTKGAEVGIDRNGTFAPLTTLPENALHRLPSTMSVERALLVEPLACVMNNLRAARLDWDDLVAVIGAGPIGMVSALVLRELASHVCVIERDAYRRKGAASFAGLDVYAALSDLSKGHRPTMIVDTTGTGLDAALATVADGGRIAVMGLDSRARSEVATMSLVTRGIHIIGAAGYDTDMFSVAVARARSLPLDSLVSHSLALSDFEDALKLLAVRGATTYAACKVALRPCGAGRRLP